VGLRGRGSGPRCGSGSGGDCTRELLRERRVGSQSSGEARGSSECGHEVRLRGAKTDERRSLREYGGDRGRTCDGGREGQRLLKRLCEDRRVDSEVGKRGGGRKGGDQRRRVRERGGERRARSEELQHGGCRRQLGNDRGEREKARQRVATRSRRWGSGRRDRELDIST
jgi:hypothetical protein